MSDVNANPSGARRPKAGDWRAEAADPGGRGKLITATLLLLTAVGGVAVGLLFYIRPATEPLLVTVPLSEYKHHAWPVNPWADADAELLGDPFRERGGESLVFNAYQYQQRDRLRLVLDWLAGKTERAPDEVKGDVTGRPLVLHVTGLGATRRGVTYLLPGDAAPGDPATWVPVDDVLDAVAAWKTPQKLLLLDLAHPIADPFGGIVTHDTADALDAQLRARLTARKLPFPVLTSCGPGELSRPADPARCSAFALYAAEGMRGLADGENDSGSRDGQVSVAELARFAANRVDRYAQAVHGRPQTPQLYTPSDAAAEFPLTYHPLPAEEAAPKVDPYPPALEQAWQFRDTVRASGADRGAPTALARLTRGLLRAEQVWRWAGRAERNEAEASPARDEWDAGGRGSGGPAPAADTFRRAVEAVGQFRLAAARVGRPEVAPDWHAAFNQYLAAKLATPPRPDDVEKLRQAQQAWRDKATANPLDAAWVVWDQAQSVPLPDQKMVSAWAEAMNEVKLPQTFAEVLLLRAIERKGDFYEQGLAAFPSAAVAALVQAEYELGKTVAAGPEGFGLVRGPLESAEIARAQGAKALDGAGTKAQILDGERLLREAAAGFREARGTLARWQEANRAWEAAVAATHGAVPSAVARNRPPLEVCEQAAAEASRLADKLAAAAQSRQFGPTGVTQDVPAVRQAAARLQEPFEPAAVKAAVESGPRTKPADLEPLYALVDGPALPAGERKKVWDVIRAETVKLHEAARATDVLPNTSAAPEREDVLTARRVRASVALLRLAGSAKAAADPAVEGFATDPAAAGDRLRVAWAAELPEAAGAAEKDGHLFAAERIARAYPPQAGPIEFTPDVPRRRADEDATAYRGWVHRQLLADRPYRTGVPGADPFYPAVAALAPK